VTERLTIKHVLIAHLNVDVFVELAKLLDRNFHVLVVPGWVLASVYAHLGTPLLTLADAHKHEWVHLVQHAATVDVQVRRHKVKSHEARLWNNKGHSLWLLHYSDLRLHKWLWLHLGLHHHLWLWLHNHCWLRVLLRAHVLNLVLVED